MVSITDVAKYTGVSTASVSRALRGLPNVSEETRAAVRRAAAELGYVPSSSAAALASGHHRAIAAIVPTLRRWFNDGVIEGADEVLRLAGYQVVLVNLGSDSEVAKRWFTAGLLRKRVDAALSLGIEFTPTELAELHSLDLPTVIVGGEIGGFLQIGIDEAAVGAAATRHLIELGHRRIAHIGGEAERGIDVSVASGRKSGWEAALSEAGLRHDEALFRAGNFRLGLGKLAALDLLTAPNRPTAIFAGSDEMAFGAILAAHELGLRVPQDVSIVGIDDHDDAAAFRLTTFRQDPLEYGRIAARMLLGQVEDAAVPTSHVRVPSPLVIRDSTAAPAS